MLSAFAIAIWSRGPWTFSKVPPQFDPIVYFCGGSVEHMDNVEHFWESSFSRPMLNQFWASWERILSRTAFVLAIRFAFYSNLFTEMMNSCICCRHYLFWATSFSHWQEVLNPQSNQLDIVDAVSSSCVRIARCISLGRIHVTQLITTGRLGEAPIVLLRSFWASRFADRCFCIFLCWLLGSSSKFWRATSLWFFLRCVSEFYCVERRSLTKLAVHRLTENPLSGQCIHYLYLFGVNWMYF